jgi:hypothetical protein
MSGGTTSGFSVQTNGCNNSNKIGLSAVSLFPHSLLPEYGLWYTEYVAREAGFDGLQLIPFWTYTKRSFNSLKCGLPVISYEGSWNHMYFDNRTTWGRMLWFDRGLLKDALLFGTKKRVACILGFFQEFFPEAISIDIKPRGVREISPHHKMSRNGWLGYRGGVVLDTHHIYEFPFIRNDADAAKFVGDLFDVNNVVLIHVQMRDKKKLKAFLSGEMTSFEAFVLGIMSLRCISLPIVVEIHPKILPFSRKKRVEVLTAVRMRIEDLLK